MHASWSCDPHISYLHCHVEFIMVVCICMQTSMASNELKPILSGNTHHCLKHWRNGEIKLKPGAKPFCLFTPPFLVWKKVQEKLNRRHLIGRHIKSQYPNSLVCWHGHCFETKCPIIFHHVYCCSTFNWWDIPFQFSMYLKSTICIHQMSSCLGHLQRHWTVKVPPTAGVRMSHSSSGCMFTGYWPIASSIEMLKPQTLLQVSWSSVVNSDGLQNTT